MCVVHLEPEEFVQLIFRKKVPIEARVYPLFGIAALIHLCHVGKTLYYMDRVETNKENETGLKSMDCYEIHAQLYRMICLDERLRLQA
ncbi:hypothetical protein [Dubosiella newyorkensis]|uniref:hypothetical protein n=1 Tax=Dubosiella newyorkensis TaxID=1862672 RepID=UPI00248B07BB|nr:hypothetical protein [Dubosiella newyorkensis]